MNFWERSDVDADSFVAWASSHNCPAISKFYQGRFDERSFSQNNLGIYGEAMARCAHAAASPRIRDAEQHRGFTPVFFALVCGPGGHDPSPAPAGVGRSPPSRPAPTSVHGPLGSGPPGH